jgi:hypothetical protein
MDSQRTGPTVEAKAALFSGRDIDGDESDCSADVVRELHKGGARGGSPPIKSMV